MSRRLSSEEYATLSDQKAEDWRSISEVNPTLFGVAGAIFAAGVAQTEAEVVALSPLPLFLGVWHMLRHARLQLQMITYLDVFAPTESSWERDIAKVRPIFWRETRGKKPRLLAELMRPSAWNTWMVITNLIALVTTFLPLLSGYPRAGVAVLIGVGLMVVGTATLIWQGHQIQPDRKRWTNLWEEHRDRP